MALSWQFQYKRNVKWQNFTRYGNAQINNAIKHLKSSTMRTSDDVSGPRVTFWHTYANPYGKHEWTEYILDLQTMMQWQTNDSVKSSSNRREVRAFMISDPKIKFEWVHNDSSEAQDTQEPQTTPRLFASWMPPDAWMPPHSTAPPPAKAPPPSFHSALGDTQAKGFQVEGGQATDPGDSGQNSGEEWFVIAEPSPDASSYTPLRTSGWVQTAHGAWVRDNDKVVTTFDQVPDDVVGSSSQPGSQPRTAFTNMTTDTAQPTQLCQRAKNGVWSPIAVSTSSWSSTWVGAEWTSDGWWAGGEDHAKDASKDRPNWTGDMYIK